MEALPAKNLRAHDASPTQAAWGDRCVAWWKSDWRDQPYFWFVLNGKFLLGNTGTVRNVGLLRLVHLTEIMMGVFNSLPIWRNLPHMIPSYSGGPKN